MKNYSVYIVVALFVLAIGFFIFYAIKRREEVFEGEVIDKNIGEIPVMNNAVGGPGMTGSGIMIGNAGGVRHTYTIKVKTDPGKVINYTISEGMYEIVKIGDRVSKPKGSTEITILNANNVPPTTPPSTNPPTNGTMPTNANPPESLV